MYMTAQYKVNVIRNIEEMWEPTWMFPGRPMPHEYLCSVYSATNEVVGMLQSLIMVSPQEDCPATNHTHGITINTHGITNIIVSSKTEVTQIIHCVMSCDRAIPTSY
jgi:hypothetical protein